MSYEQHALSTEAARTALSGEVSAPPFIEAPTVRVSCVIPTYNRGNVLCETIRMLMEQSHAPEEIIVVDQSTEMTDEYAAQLASWDREGNIRWLRREKPNASAARNAGAMASTGDVLLFLDDDIRVGPDFIAAHARNYESEDVVAVAGQLLDGDGAVATERKKRSSNPELDWMFFPRNYAHRCRTSWMISANVSVRRNIFFEVGGMDENYIKGAICEETDFALRLVRKGYLFQFDPQASVYHLGLQVSKGGTRHRHWWSYFYSAVGHWYFALGFASRGTAAAFFLAPLRFWVLNSATLKRPWSIPPRFVFCVSALVVAAALRARGARTLGNARSPARAAPQVDPHRAALQTTAARPVRAAGSPSMIGTLFVDRYRPRFGSKTWAKYWAKRLRLLPALVRAEISTRRYRRRCGAFGKRTIISPSDIDRRLERLAIGDDCAIGRVAIQLHAPVTIGDCVVINDGCRLLSGTHNVHSPEWELIAKPIEIGDYAWIATGAVILPGVTIGRGAVVGAGAVVARSVEPLAIVAGNPAQTIGSRQTDVFAYRPSAAVALFEAWLGPVARATEKGLV
jgi:acetyltransferase-like isoleucine patch superfamily enzyme/GT2 family glycosyltransferase